MYNEINKNLLKKSSILKYAIQSILKKIDNICMVNSIFKKTTSKFCSIMINNINNSKHTNYLKFMLRQGVR